MRIPGWRGRLNEYIESCRLEPFAYGAHDCSTFAAGAVQAITGQDHRAWAGTYDSYAAGLRRVKENGWMDHIDYVSAHFASIPVAQAGIGDLAAVAGDDGPRALGVCNGERVFVLRPDGLGTVDLMAARRAWRV